MFIHCISFSIFSQCLFFKKKKKTGKNLGQVVLNILSLKRLKGFGFEKQTIHDAPKKLPDHAPEGKKNKQTWMNAWMNENKQDKHRS